MEIREVHKINMSLLNEVDRICRKYNIKYRLEAGTLLGAIRHKGFIPWDDDCDVVFMRDEYEKFLSVLEKEKLPDGMVFIRANVYTQHFHDFVDRLFFVNVVYRNEDVYKERFNGDFKYLWLDFFVLDKVPCEKQKLVYLKQKIIYGLAMGHRYEINYKKYDKVSDKIKAFVLSFVGKMIPLTIIRKWQESLSKKYNDTDTDLLYFSNYPAVFMGYTSNVMVESDLIQTAFEDGNLPIVKDYDRMLTYYYGDYKKFPPVEKQIPEHRNIFREE